MLNQLLNLYSWILLVRVVISWVNPNPYNPIVKILYVLTEPVLAPIRRMLPQTGGIDLSPLIVFAALWFLMGLV